MTWQEDVSAKKRALNGCQPFVRAAVLEWAKGKGLAVVRYGLYGKLWRATLPTPQYHGYLAAEVEDMGDYLRVGVKRVPDGPANDDAAGQELAKELKPSELSVMLVNAIDRCK